MKHKNFKSRFTKTTLTNGYFGDEGICIYILETNGDVNNFKAHVFNNEKEVKRLIKQLKKSLS